jgi:hypothetical protein
VNRYFGDPWDAPFVEDALRVPTPVGEPCLTCDEPIAEGDQGMVTSYLYEGFNGALAQREAAQHRECMLLGVVGYLAGQCQCFPGKGSLRERGRATVAWAEANRT